jgi:hypothetical protein
LELWCGWFWVVSVLQASACNTDTFLWKSNKCYIFWVCVCSLRCPAFSARTPYCHLWPVWLYNVFPRYVTKRTVFGKKNTEHKMCFLISSTSFVWKISHSRKKWVR